MVIKNKEKEIFDFKEFSSYKEIYDDSEIYSNYIKMCDNVKIAVNVLLPKSLPKNHKITTILVQTRYWRDFALRKPLKWLKPVFNTIKYRTAFNRYGFAVVVVDVRGTGASFGTRSYPWSENEIKDMKEIINWIINQSWSDGNIFPYGHSYSGNTAELAGVLGHPAVKGLIPMHCEFDPYTDIAFPGGIYNKVFVDEWIRYNDCLDKNNLKGLGFIYWLFFKGVKPVDLDSKRKLLKKAILEHEFNLNIAKLAKNITYRDDNWDESGKTIKNFSTYRYQTEIERLEIPIFCWGSWMDAATGSNIIIRFINYKNPLIAVIGAWTHGAEYHASPYEPLKKKETYPPYEILFQEWLKFIETCLNDGKLSGKILFYYTIGEEKWKSTTCWPPLNQFKHALYLSKNKSLSFIKPTDIIGEDKYIIDFTVGTGKNNRWMTEVDERPVFYNNRDKKEKKMLVYTSSPLTEKIEITGYPIITLFLKSTHEDGTIFIYLEEIDEQGKITYITEGQFRLIHRKISDDEPPYEIPFPYHSFKKRDGIPMLPGVFSEIKFELFPISVLVKKNHRIRIAIAGADNDTFLRIPKKGTPEITIARKFDMASCIELPIIEKSF